MILFGWTLGQTMIVLGFGVGMLVGLFGLLVGVGAREGSWRDRIASGITGLALIIWLGGLVNGIMLWNHPLVAR